MTDEVQEYNETAGIVAKNIVKGYDQVKVLNGISFSLPQGETLVILGPSGCGKTTLLRIVAGLEIPESGEIISDNRVISRAGWASEPHTRGMGFVFQNSSLWPHMTVRENILFGLHSVKKTEAEERMHEVLTDFAARPLIDRYPDQLSGGEVRRVAIARTLAARPRIVLMDEPLTNLNAELKQQLLDCMLRKVVVHKSSLLYVTHDEKEADFLGGKRLKLKSRDDEK